MIHEWKYFLVDETKTMASSTEEVFKFFGALVGKSMPSRVAFKKKNVFNWMLTLHLTYLLRFVQIVQMFILCCFVVVIQLDVKWKGAIFLFYQWCNFSDRLHTLKFTRTFTMSMSTSSNSEGNEVSFIDSLWKQRSNVIHLAWCNGFLNAFISCALSSIW